MKRARTRTVVLAVSGMLLASLMPAAVAGAATATASSPDTNPFDTASFKSTCTVAHSSPDDPIVHPRQPGTSHMHDFAGNVSTNAASDFASLNAAKSNCSDPADRSAYWTPSVYVKGVQAVPTKVHAYY